MENLPIPGNQQNANDTGSFCTLSEAKELISYLLASYPSQKLSDYEGTVAMYADVMIKYPLEIVKMAVKPTGIPTDHPTYLPNAGFLNNWLMGKSGEKHRDEFDAIRGFDKEATKVAWLEIIDRVGEDAIKARLRAGWQIKKLRLYWEKYGSLPSLAQPPKDRGRKSYEQLMAEVEAARIAAELTIAPDVKPGRRYTYAEFLLMAKEGKVRPRPIGRFEKAGDTHNPMAIPDEKRG